MTGYKLGRTSEDIKREIIAIMRELKDPRIQGVLTVLRVDVSNDLSYAKVYVSAVEGIETAKTAVKGLKAASGFIRRELSKNLRLRKTPELNFIADDSVEHGMKIFEKLEGVSKKDDGED